VQFRLSLICPQRSSCSADTYTPVTIAVSAQRSWTMNASLCVVGHSLHDLCIYIYILLYIYILVSALFSSSPARGRWRLFEVAVMCAEGLMDGLDRLSAHTFWGLFFSLSPYVPPPPPLPPLVYCTAACTHSAGYVYQSTLVSAPVCLRIRIYIYRTVSEN